MTTTKMLRLTSVMLLGAVSAMAQQSACTIKLDQLPPSPELFGFHLGMTFEQVKTRVPQVRFPAADALGVAKTSISPSYDPSFDQAGFAGARTVSMDFLDGKLSTLWIGYDGTFKWQNLDEFVAGISKALNLPATWPTKGPGRQLTCDGFSVMASMIGGSPALRIANEEAQATIQTRREEAAAAAEAAEAAEQAMVIGDARTKLYYPNGCAAADSVPENSRVTFKDKDEAEKSGYKRAKECP